MIIIKSAAKKTLIGTLGAASLLVAGTQVAHADTVKVQSGDTVWAYSQKYHVSIDSIVKANKLADANLILAGHSLNIPGVNTSDASQTSTAAASTATTSTATSAASQATTQSSAASSVASSSAVSSSSAATSTTAAASATANTNASNSNSSQATAQSSQAATSYDSAISVRGGGVSQALAIANGSTPYVHGGSSLSGFDCSGFVQYVYGLSARTTTQQAKLGTHHSDVQNAPYGALLFWGSDSAPYHVGISLGNGTYVAAQNSQKGIGEFSQTYYKASFYVNVK